MVEPGDHDGPLRDRVLANNGGWGRRALLTGLAALLYAGLAALAFFPVVPWSSTKIFGCACYDTPQQVWFISWVPHLLTSGGNPFYSTSIDVPSGANMLVNTSMMFLSALLSGVTFLLGPVAALNIGMRLAFGASGIAAFSVLRTWGVRWPAAFLGGVMYGFSPYLVGQGSGHLQMAFVVVPPLWLLAWERMFNRRWSPRRAGLWLGCLGVIQFFIAIDVLASLLVMSLVGLGILAGFNRQQIKARVPDALRTTAYAGCVAVPLLAVPIAYTLVGPGSFLGPQQPVTILGALRADLLSVVVPTNLQRLGPASWIALGSSFGTGNLSENGEYLGIPLVLALVGVTVWQRRSSLVTALAGIGAVAFILTLGSSLTIDGHDTWIRLPFDVLSHLPILRDQVPLRYSLYLQLAASLLVGVGLDRALTRVLRMRPAGRGRLASVAAVGLLCACAVAPLWPNLPYGSRGTQVPTFFAADEAAEIPAGSNVLTYPYPAFPYDQAMLWQATDGLRYRLIGGYMYTTTPAGTATLIPPMLQPDVVQTILSDALWGSGDDGLPSGTSMSAAEDAFRTFLDRYGVSTVIVERFGAFPQTVAEVVTGATGEPPENVGGILLWHVGAR